MYFQSEQGYFGEFGGAFVPEILHETMKELREAYQAARSDPLFWQSYEALLKSYSGRPTPVTYLENLSRKLQGAKLYLKREDLNHTGAHKVNNVLGQGLLAKRMGKKRIIAETGAGQHGVASAVMAAKLGFDCTIYMGAKDIDRQYPNVFWMEKLGAQVVSVEDGDATLRDAIDEALRDWADSHQETHYVLGTACGPHPFPEMVAWFQSVIGTEARAQFLDLTGGLPDAVLACVGGGSNATGIFGAFLADPVELIGVEAGGKGVETGLHAARVASKDGAMGVAQGYKTLFLQNRDGQMRHTSSIAAGLDYTGISPILAHGARSGRIKMGAAKDDQVVSAVKELVREEGIIPALETAHSVAYALEEAKKRPGQSLLINMSGRGDKDIFGIADALEDEGFKQYLRTRC